MQFHRNKNAGCLDMSHLKVVAGFCAATVLAFLLVMFLDVANGPCDDTQMEIHNNRKPLYYSLTADRSNHSQSQAECQTGTTPGSGSPAPAVCYREWERPSVTDERAWEALADDNAPEVQRTFTPLGVASFLFIQFGAYRAGPSNFSIVGLSPKTLHVYGNPGFECTWVPKSLAAGGREPIRGSVVAYLPGIKLADQYTGTVIHCNFETDVGTDGGGGSLEIVAQMGSKDATGLQNVQFTAITESPGEYNGSLFEQPLKYDHVYCGSPLYGQISPQRVREWLAYHARLFGPRSHFILYDAGGFHDEVRRILAPWVKLGKVSIMNYRQEARYDSHYHSQAVAVNDCLLQAKRIGEWAYFFDLDEYLSVPPHLTVTQVMREIVGRRGRRAQQITFIQLPMNNNHCVKRPANQSDEAYKSLWGIEKLVFQRTQVTEWGGWKDHKYAVQTRYILAAGTHDHEFALVPEGLKPKETIEYMAEDRIHYHHYHNTINVREDLCKEFVDPWIKETKFNNVTHVYDNSMASLADAVRQFELETVGPQPFIL